MKVVKGLKVNLCASEISPISPIPCKWRVTTRSALGSRSCRAIRTGSRRKMTTRSCHPEDTDGDCESDKMHRPGRISAVRPDSKSGTSAWLVGQQPDFDVPQGTLGRARPTIATHPALASDSDDTHHRAKPLRHRAAALSPSRRAAFHPRKCEPRGVRRAQRNAGA